MPQLLPPLPLLLTFLAASFVLAVTPGPGVLYIVTRSLTQGRASGMASVAGVALGNLGNAVGASLGLAAVLATSAAAFLVVKLVGAVYLIYLGVQAMRAPRRPESGATTLQPAPPRRILVDGFFVALLNPKTALFFGAFLPQFMNPEAASIIQSVTLGALFVCIAAATDTVYALAAGTMAPIVSRRIGMTGGGRYLTGGFLVGLGLFTAFSGSREASRP